MVNDRNRLVLGAGGLITYITKNDLIVQLLDFKEKQQNILLATPCKCGQSFTF